MLTENNEKIRIAYLISRYPAISHTFILREIRHLRRLGFEIAVASINPTDRDSSQLTHEEREEMMHTFYVKPAGIQGAAKAHFYTLLTQPLRYVKGLWFALRLGQLDLKKILYGWFYFIEAVMVGHWMRQQHCSHLHVHFGMASSTVGLIVQQTFPIHLSLTIHGPDEFYDTPSNYLTQKILHADFICCISHFARSQLMMLSPPTEWQKLEISPLGVDPSIFTPRPFRQYPTPFELLCVGRLVPVKGQFILIAAIERLLAQGRQVRLRLIGDGPDRENLAREISQHQLTDHILLEGAVNQDRILEFYKKADIFVLASFAEGLPVVLMEAMAMEIPCVTTHITGIPELFQEYINTAMPIQTPTITKSTILQQYGLLVAPADVSALTNALMLLMDKPSLRLQLGQHGRHKVLKDYELQNNTEKLAQIFRRRITPSMHHHLT
jgi:colanic acid/amylovoran biosynthesis glycosyltransferase